MNSLIFKVSVAFFLLTNLALANQNFNSNLKSYNNKLQIVNDAKNLVAEFKVKVANSDEVRQYGLMNLSFLPANYGMIFEFNSEKNVAMWMKNTKIPLDMLFIDKDNRIVDIFSNTKPYSLEIITSPFPIRKVLEINAGLAKKLGIQTNHKVLTFTK